ncbi:MAG: ABC transporter ATP-binding protein [bacterium]
MTNFAVEVENVTKFYPTGFLYLRRKCVLKDVTLKIPQGTIFGVLGPNGAGKTTLLSLIAGLISPDGGTLSVFGKNVAHNADFVRKQINLCSGNPNFVWCMTVAESLSFYAMLYGMLGKKKRERVEEVISVMELKVHRNTRFDELSTGIKQRLALAKALLSEPRILFLDEPTLGLDPHMAIKAREAIRSIHATKGITIVLTSHYMKEVEEVCERVAFLREGCLVAEGTPDELMKKVEFKVAKPTMEDVFLELVQ